MKKFIISKRRLYILVLLLFCVSVWGCDRVVELSLSDNNTPIDGGNQADAGDDTLDGSVDAGDS